MTFVVLGTPATKGSTVSFVGDHGVVTKADCRGLAAWAQAVAWAAKWAHVPLTSGAVQLTLTFQFRRPKRDQKRVHHLVKPDVDKLARAILDSLTGVAYHDDAQVIALHAVKTYGEDVRTTITIEAL